MIMGSEIEAIMRSVDGERQRQGLSKSELARKSGEPRSTLCRALQEYQGMKLSTLLNVLDALGITVVLLNRDGFMLPTSEACIAQED